MCLVQAVTHALGRSPVQPKALGERPVTREHIENRNLVRRIKEMAATRGGHFNPAWYVF
jgi:hypothetical protein